MSGGGHRATAPRLVRPAVEVAVPPAAMVLAAGLGTRMRPVTDTCPKPLVTVAGKTLLDWALDHVRAAGIGRVVVNVHYLADQVEDHLRGRADGGAILISDERDRLLETGGGVAKALPLLDAPDFYVINADNLWVDGLLDTLRHMARLWRPDTMDGLLLMVPLARAEGYDGRGDFRMDGLGRLSRRPETKVAPFVFSGVQILGRSLFDGVTVEPFSLNRLYDKAIAAGRLYGVVHTGQWFHVGTPEAIGRTAELMAHG